MIKVTATVLNGHAAEGALVAEELVQVLALFGIRVGINEQP